MSVKAVMRRKLVDHYEIDQALGGKFNFVGGFSVTEFVEDGALNKAEYEGEPYELELEENDDSALTNLAYSASMIAVLALALF